MLEIQTEFGNFMRPKDLLLFMNDEGISEAHVKVEYCFEEVFEKDMSKRDVSIWAATYISPVTSSLKDALLWLRGGA